MTPPAQALPPPRRHDRARPPSPADTAFVARLDSWEGPLDVLLDLAERQKVDLGEIRLVDLVDQAITWIAALLSDQRAPLERAADCLVLLAGVAVLKARLLLAAGTAEPGSGGDDAAALRCRLLQLQAMRRAAVRLMARPRLGVDVFARGAPEDLRLRGVILCEGREIRTAATLRAIYDATERRPAPAPAPPAVLRIPLSQIASIETALPRLQRALAAMTGRTPLPMAAGLMEATEPGDPGQRLIARSHLAASFAAGLELARGGLAELGNDPAGAVWIAAITPGRAPHAETAAAQGAEEGFRVGDKPVSAEVVEAVLSRHLDDLEPRLTRHGYNVKILSEQFNAKPAEVRQFLRGQLDQARSRELVDQMLAAGLPM